MLLLTKQAVRDHRTAALKKAAQTYQQAKDETEQHLDTLRELLAAHAAPGEVLDYGHVGDLTHVNNRLKEVVCFLSQD